MRNATSSISLLICFLIFTACSTTESENGSFRIARERNWYAVNLKDREQSVLAFSDELLEMVTEIEEIDFEMQLLPTGNSVSELRRGNVDGVLTALKNSGPGSERFLLSETYLALGNVLLVRTDSAVSSMDDMYEKMLGVSYGTSLAFDVSQNPSMAIREYARIGEAIDDLVNGHIDAVAADFLVASDYANNIYEGSIKIILPPITNNGLRLMILKDDPRGEQLMDHFTTGLQKLRQDGNYQLLREKWKL